MNSAPLLYWVEEREKIRLARLAGLPQPWTSDPILHQYRFCNVRRRDDRVSRWIIESVIDPYADHPNLWVMLALARYVNWPDTILELMDEDLWPKDPKPNWLKIGQLIDARAARGEQAWTGAYMIRAESNPKAEWYSWGKGRYVAQIVVARELWNKSSKILAALKTGRAEAVWASIAGRYGWGSFMAGQVVADYTYSPLLSGAPDLYTWAPLGPGSKRGLNRLAGRELTAEISQAQAVDEMRELYKDIILDLSPAFGDITLHDVQNCLCELDKYLRAKLGEGRPRSNFKPQQGRL